MKNTSCTRAVHRLGVGVICGVFAATGVDAWAANIRWNNASGGDLNTPANWIDYATSNPPATLNNADVPFIFLNGDKTLTLSANRAFGTLNVGTTSGVTTLQSATASQVTLTANGLSLGGTITTPGGAAATYSGSKLTVGANFYLYTGAFGINIGNQVDGGNAELSVNGTGSQVQTNIDLTVGLSGGSNSTVSVSNSGRVNAAGLRLGTNSASASGNKVSISGAGSSFNIIGSNTSYYVSAVRSNSIEVTDGGKLTSTKDINLGTQNNIFNNATYAVGGGTLILDGGSVELDTGKNLYLASTTTNATKIQGSGSISGASIQNPLTIAGKGFAEVGIGANGSSAGYGVLNATLTSGWLNDFIELKLDVGDVSGGATAGINFDQLNLTGNFAMGGRLTVDLTNAIFGNTTVQLINWSSYSGNTANLNIAFIGASGLENVVIDNAGVYLAVPEPSVAVLLGLGLTSLLFFRRKI